MVTVLFVLNHTRSMKVRSMGIPVIYYLSMPEFIFDHMTTYARALESHRQWWTAISVEYALTLHDLYFRWDNWCTTIIGPWNLLMLHQTFGFSNKYWIPESMNSTLLIAFKEKYFDKEHNIFVLYLWILVGI